MLVRTLPFFPVWIPFELATNEKRGTSEESVGELILWSGQRQLQPRQSDISIHVADAVAARRVVEQC